jgi:hypothetical protein
MTFAENAGMVDATSSRQRAESRTHQPSIENNPSAGLNLHGYFHSAFPNCFSVKIPKAQVFV